MTLLFTGSQLRGAIGARWSKIWYGRPGGETSRCFLLEKKNERPKQHSRWITLPETSKLHLPGSHSKRKVVFQPSYFKWYVSFREGICQLGVDAQNAGWNPKRSSLLFTGLGNLKRLSLSGIHCELVFGVWTQYISHKLGSGCFLPMLRNVFGEAWWITPWK